MYTILLTAFLVSAIVMVGCGFGILYDKYWIKNHEPFPQFKVGDIREFTLTINVRNVPDADVKEERWKLEKGVKLVEGPTDRWSFTSEGKHHYLSQKTLNRLWRKGQVSHAYIRRSTGGSLTIRSGDATQAQSSLTIRSENTSSISPGLPIRSVMAPAAILTIPLPASAVLNQYAVNGEWRVLGSQRTILDSIVQIYLQSGALRDVTTEGADPTAALRQMSENLERTMQNLVRNTRLPSAAQEALQQISRGFENVWTTTEVRTTRSPAMPPPAGAAEDVAPPAPVRESPAPTTPSAIDQILADDE